MGQTDVTSAELTEHKGHPTLRPPGMPSFGSAETRERSDVRLQKAINTRAGVGTKEEIESEPEGGLVDSDDAEEKGYFKEEQSSDSPSTFSEGEETQRSEDRQPRSSHEVRLTPRGEARNQVFQNIMQNRGMQAAIRDSEDPEYIGWAADCDEESREQHQEVRHVQ